MLNDLLGPLASMGSGPAITNAAQEQSLGQQIQQALSGIGDSYVEPELTETPEMPVAQNIGLALADALQMYGRGLNRNILPGRHVARESARLERKGTRAEQRADKDALRQTAINSAKANAELADLQMQRSQVIAKGNRMAMMAWERQKQADLKSFRDRQLDLERDKIEQAERLAGGRAGGKVPGPGEYSSEEWKYIDAASNELTAVLAGLSSEELTIDEANEKIRGIKLRYGANERLVAWIDNQVATHLYDSLVPKPVTDTGGDAFTTVDPLTGEVKPMFGAAEYIDRKMSAGGRLLEDYVAGVNPMYPSHGPLTAEDFAALDGTGVVSRNPTGAQQQPIPPGPAVEMNQGNLLPQNIVPGGQMAGAVPGQAGGVAAPPAQNLPGLTPLPGYAGYQDPATVTDASSKILQRHQISTLTVDHAPVIARELGVKADKVSDDVLKRVWLGSEKETPAAPAVGFIKRLISLGEIKMTVETQEKIRAILASGAGDPASQSNVSDQFRAVGDKFVDFLEKLKPASLPSERERLDNLREYMRLIEEQD